MESFGALFDYACLYKPKTYCYTRLRVHSPNIVPESTHFAKLVSFFVEMCKMSEIRNPCRFRTLLQHCYNTGKVLDGRKLTCRSFGLGAVGEWLPTGCSKPIQTSQQCLLYTPLVQTVHLRWGSARKRFGGGNRKKQSLETVAELFSSLQTSKPSPPLLPHPKQCCGGF